MGSYEVRYTRVGALGAWGTDTHLYPAAVIFEARDPRGSGPDIVARCEIRAGVPEVVDLRVTAKPDGRPVRSVVLDGVPNMRTLAVDAFRKYAYRRDDPVIAALRAGENPGLIEIAAAAGPRDDRESWKIENDLMTAQEQSQSGPAPTELEKVATVYREAVGEKPVEAVQFYLGVSYRTAARRVEQARAKGLLPPTTQGKRKG